MFGWMKSDPKKKLQQQYEQKMKEAMLLQRSGNMAAFAEKSAEAEVINKQLNQLQAEASD